MILNTSNVLKLGQILSKSQNLEIIDIIAESGNSKDIVLNDTTIFQKMKNVNKKINKQVVQNILKELWDFELISSEPRNITIDNRTKTVDSYSLSAKGNALISNVENILNKQKVPDVITINNAKSLIADLHQLQDPQNEETLISAYQNITANMQIIKDAFFVTSRQIKNKMNEPMDENTDIQKKLSAFQKAELPIIEQLRPLDTEFDKILREPDTLNNLAEALSNNDFELIMSTSAIERNIKQEKVHQELIETFKQYQSVSYLNNQNANTLAGLVEAVHEGLDNLTNQIINKINNNKTLINLADLLEQRRTEVLDDMYSIQLFAEKHAPLDQDSEIELKPKAITDFHFELVQKEQENRKAIAILNENPQSKAIHEKLVKESIAGHNDILQLVNNNEITIDGSLELQTARARDILWSTLVADKNQTVHGLGFDLKRISQNPGMSQIKVISENNTITIPETWKIQVNIRKDYNPNHG